MSCAPRHGVQDFLDDAEFQKIYEENRRIVYAAVRFFTTDPDTLEDLYQEIWLNVHRNLSTFRGGSKLSTWIYGIARNTALAWRKKLRRFPLLEKEPVEPSVAGFEGQLINQVTLQDAMLKLTADEQELLIYKYAHDCDYEELSARFNVPLSTIKSRLFEARKKMRMILEA